MEDRKLNRIPLVMANEPGRAHIDNLYFVSGIVFQSCVANESVCASHLGKCGNEGETLVCHVQAVMRCLLPRIVFLGIGVQSRWQIAYEAKHMFETDRVQVP